MAKKFSSLSITENLDVKLTCYFNVLFSAVYNARSCHCQVIYSYLSYREKSIMCRFISFFSSPVHFVMLILVGSLSNCVQRQTELRASTLSHICTFVWSCQTMESSHLFKQNQCEIRTIPWDLSWTTQIL